MSNAQPTILSSSSYDIAHPPQNVLNSTVGKPFWISTGSFPQEIVIQLGSSSPLKTVQIVSAGIRKVEIAKCEGSQANTWETVATQSSDEAVELQRIQLDIPNRVNATYFKIKVLSAWSDHIVIYKVLINGSEKK